MHTSEPEMSQFEQRADNCQKLGKTAAEMFQIMQQVYIEDALSHSVVFRCHRRFWQARVWKIMCGLVGHKQFGLNARCNKFMPAYRSKWVDDITAAVGVSHGTCYKILSDDLNMSRVTQHSVPRIRSQVLYIASSRNIYHEAETKFGFDAPSKDRSLLLSIYYI